MSGDLEPIVYERGPNGGWIVPASERARWDKPVKALPPRPPGQEFDDQVESLPALIKELDRYLVPSLSARLRGQLERYYLEDAVGAIRLVRSTIDGILNGSLYAPDGFIASRLQDYAQRPSVSH